MNKIIIAMVSMLVVAGGVYVYSNNQKEAAMVEQKMMEEEKKMMEKKAMEEKEQMKDQDMMKKDGETAMPKEETSMMEKKAMEEKEQMKDQDMMKKDGETAMPKEETSMMESSAGNTMNNEDTMMKMGTYEAYSADKLARAETGDVVLFFHASWCPSCRGLNANIESNQKSIPESVSILKLDYDKETELKKKYGVTYQHTLVQVDRDGNMIKKWSGSGSLNNLLTQIK